ncbi:MAG: Flp family type IVb pilin [Solirubrobacterales bacterium]
MNLLKRLTQEEQGQGMTEYGLIIALIAVVVIGGLVLLGPKIKDMFTTVSNNL